MRTRACVPHRRRGCCPPSPWSLPSCSPAPLPPPLPLLSPAKPAPSNGSRRKAASECGCVRRRRCKSRTVLIILQCDLINFKSFTSSSCNFAAVSLVQFVKTAQFTFMDMCRVVQYRVSLSLNSSNNKIKYAFIFRQCKTKRICN